MNNANNSVDHNLTVLSLTRNSGIPESGEVNNQSVTIGESAEPKAELVLSMCRYGFFPTDIALRMVQFAIHDLCPDSLALRQTCKAMLHLVNRHIVELMKINISQMIESNNWNFISSYCTKLLQMESIDIGEKEKLSINLIAPLISEPLTFDEERGDIGEMGLDYAGIHKVFLEKISNNRISLEISLDALNMILEQLGKDHSIRIYFLKLINELFNAKYVSNDLIEQASIIQSLLAKLNSEDSAIMLEGCQYLKNIIDPLDHFKLYGWRTGATFLASNPTIMNTLIRVLKIGVERNDEQALIIGYQILTYFTNHKISQECEGLVYAFVKEQMSANCSYPFVEGTLDLKDIVSRHLMELLRLQCIEFEEEFYAELMHRACSKLLILEVKVEDKHHSIIQIALNLIDAIEGKCKLPILKAIELLLKLKKLKEECDSEEIQVTINVHILQRVKIILDNPDTNEASGKVLFESIMELPCFGFIREMDVRFADESLNLIYKLIDRALIDSTLKDRIYEKIDSVIAGAQFSFEALADILDLLVKKGWATDEEVDKKYINSLSESDEEAA